MSKLLISSVLNTDANKLAHRVTCLKQYDLGDHIGWEKAREIALVSDSQTGVLEANLGSLSTFKGVQHGYLRIHPSLLVKDIPDELVVGIDKERGTQDLLDEISRLEDECIIAKLVQDILVNGNLNRENLYCILQIFGDIPDELCQEIKKRFRSEFEKEILVQQAKKYIKDSENTSNPHLSFTRNTSTISLHGDKIFLEFVSFIGFSSSKTRTTFVSERDEEKMRFCISAR